MRLVFSPFTMLTSMTQMQRHSCAGTTSILITAQSIRYSTLVFLPELYQVMGTTCCELSNALQLNTTVIGKTSAAGVCLVVLLWPRVSSVLVKIPKC